eukprot:Lithocolla_globosa_v1_NODE_11257_length_522_cov_4.543897.p1 type:complete len:119 gc:universal NODE_11257_length_522_cov_4.543897:75-431(+)
MANNFMLLGWKEKEERREDRERLCALLVVPNQSLNWTEFREKTLKNHIFFRCQAQVRERERESVSFGLFMLFCSNWHDSVPTPSQRFGFPSAAHHTASHTHATQLQTTRERPHAGPAS